MCALQVDMEGESDGDAEEDEETMIMKGGAFPSARFPNRTGPRSTAKCTVRNSKIGFE